MSTPTEWIEAVERKLGHRLTRAGGEFVTTYVTEETRSSLNDEDVDGIIRLLDEETDYRSKGRDW